MKELFHSRACIVKRDIILLTTGHQSRAVLEKCQCVAVVDSAEEALELILS